LEDITMNKPEKRFKCGPITASTWPETKIVEGEMVKFYSISIDRSYREGDEWKHTTSFAVEDLPKVALVANEAYKYLRLSSTDQED
jgi:hypothetical protein